MTAPVRYTMHGQMPSAPYQDVVWSVFNTPDTTGQFSGYGAGFLINIYVDYTTVDNVVSGGNEQAPQVPVPQPTDPIIAQITYVMKGLCSTTEPPNALVTWRSVGSPDFTGQFSGYPTSSLSNVVVDYTINDNVTSSAQAIPVSPTGPVGGDLSGNMPDPIVVGWQGRPLSATAPTIGQVMSWNGTNWIPFTLSGVFVAGGDLSGTSTDQTVIGLQGYPISATAPTTNYVLEWNGSVWIPTALPGSLPPSGAAGGDLSGTYPNPTVAKIQGNPVKSQSLGSTQDGYVLTWKNSDGEWEAEPTSGSSILSGDVTGPGYSNTISKLQGVTLSASSPSTNQILQYNGSAWVPVTGSFFTAGGDLSGTSTSQTVVGFYNKPVASTSPVNSAVPVWDSSIYDIRQLTLDDILPAFAITSFTGGSTVECGATVTNPSFTITYASSATSASITNTDGTDSPLTLTTPFTSGTVVGSFSKTVVNAAVTFTLSAYKNSINKTATQNITFEARSFGGVGSAGATSSVTASGNTAILSNSAVLANEGLHSSDVGQVYGPFSPSNQKIYLLLIGGSHTFKDNTTGFAFVFNSPTSVSFTNQNSAVVSMYLYESTNLLSATYSILVVT